MFKQPPYFNLIGLCKVEREIGKIHDLKRSDFSILECYYQQQILEETKTLMDARDNLQAYLDQNSDELSAEDYDLLVEYIDTADELIEAYNDAWRSHQ